MRTAVFVMFVVVTAAAAALSTLVASRYLSLERDLADTRSQMEEIQRERKRQEEEKIVLRLDRERIQSDLEARFSEQRSQLEECSNQRQRDFQEILATLNILQKRITEFQVQTAPSAPMEQAKPKSDEAPAGTSDASQHKDAAGQPSSSQTQPAQRPQPPAKATDVPKGAIPTPEQEAKKLDKVN